MSKYGTSSSGGGSVVQVTLEPFTSSGATENSTNSLTQTNLGATSLSTSGLPHLQRESSLLKEFVSQQWSGSGASPMDTSSDYEFKSSPTTSAAPTSSTTSNLGGGGGAKEKDGTSDKKDGGGKGEKDSKYLENFLLSLGPLPEFIKEKVGKIKGLEKAVQLKTAALKDASAFHVQMIHLKLTPAKNKSSSEHDSILSSLTGASNSNQSSSNYGNYSTSNNMDVSSSTGSTYGTSNSNYSSNNYGSSNSSSNFSSNPAGLPPLPNPSPLSSQLPYTLTPAVVQPLPTENLLNNITYLLVGPVVHQDLMLNPNAPPVPSNSAQHSSSSTSSTTTNSGTSGNSMSLSRQEMGIMPMNISPAAIPSTGKKTLTAQAQSALAHPYASIPNPNELLSTAVQPITIDPPTPALSNEALDFRKKYAQGVLASLNEKSSSQQSSSATTSNTSSTPSTLPGLADYDLDAAEKIMREHQALLMEWQKKKSVLITELYEQIDSLLKRADSALKKQENKLRRGAFEVPATPIDRRRTTMLAAAAAATASAAAAAAAASTTATSSSTSSSSSTSAADLARKRSYTHMIQEVEARELQYALQNELRAEIEKQSANAMASARGGTTATDGSGATGTGATTGTGGGVDNLGEPIYCLCKKVSFGAMVACDNPDCETEWFHFACVGLDTKPRGKWLCQDCRKKTKKQKLAHEKEEKEGGTSGTSSKDEKKEKDKESKHEKEKDKEGHHHKEKHSKKHDK